MVVCIYKVVQDTVRGRQNFKLLITMFSPSTDALSCEEIKQLQFADYLECAEKHHMLTY